MRSRYTAYTLLNNEYLRKTWHSTTRPQEITLDSATQWLRLKIIHSEYDQIEFVATYRLKGRAYKLHENSQFIFEDQQWFYLNKLAADS